MRVIFVIQLFLCLTILNLEIIQAQTGNQLALQGIYHYQSMKINESIESLTDALKAGIDDIKLRKDALYYLSKAYLINKNEEMAQKYICQLSQEYPGFEQEETISAHFRELLDQCGQQSAIPQPKHQGISTKKILSYTLLGAGAVCFGLGYNQNKNAQDMQSKYENEETSYENLLNYKEERNSSLKNRDRYYTISGATFGAGLILFLWDQLSDGDSHTRIVDDNPLTDQFKLQVKPELSQQKLSLRICKRF